MCVCGERADIALHASRIADRPATMCASSWGLQQPCGAGVPSSALHWQIACVVLCVLSSSVGRASPWSFRTARVTVSMVIPKLRSRCGYCADGLSSATAFAAGVSAPSEACLDIGHGMTCCISHAGP
jgi:hypothetical protein